MFKGSRAHIFSCVRPFYKRAMSDLDRSMNRSLWVKVAHNSFIEGLHTTKNMGSGSFKHFPLIPHISSLKGTTERPENYYPMPLGIAYERRRLDGKTTSWNSLSLCNTNLII